MNLDPAMPAELGEYTLRERIGGGPNCSVWLAERQTDGGRFALKVLAPRYAADASRVASFEAEARLAQSFEHPNIVRVSEVITDSSSPLPFFVMDLLAGGNLGQFRGVSPDKAASLIGVFAAVSNALEYLHRRGLVHCDVKPSNILLGEQQRPCLTDFGMTASPDDLEQSGSHGGTILYMSPEQFESFSSGPGEGRRVDARSDIYSMGVLMYDLFTGQMPFTGSTRYALMYRRLTADPPPPSELCEALVPGLEAIILKAMAREPAARFQTAAELAAALQRLLA